MKVREVIKLLKLVNPESEVFIVNETSDPRWNKYIPVKTINAYSNGDGTEKIELAGEYSFRDIKKIINLGKMTPV